MYEASRALIGEHDFSAFRAAECQAHHPVRKIQELTIERRGDGVLLEIEANAFLHHMVRNIVGTIVDVGTGKLSADEFQRIFVGRDRRQAGATAPGAGLCLLRVFYEKP